MSVVVPEASAIDADPQHGSFWRSLRGLVSPARVRTETWEHTRLHVRRAVNILNDLKAETLDHIASILQDISNWNTAVTTKVNELALNLVELYVTLLISMAPEVKNLPPEVFEQLAGILTQVRDLLEHRSRLSLVQRSFRRKKFRDEIAVYRIALINVVKLKPCSNSSAIRRNFIFESQIRLHDSEPGTGTLSASPELHSGDDDRSDTSSIDFDAVREATYLRRPRRRTTTRSSSNDSEIVKPVQYASYQRTIALSRGESQSTGSPATTVTLIPTLLDSDSIFAPDVHGGLDLECAPPEGVGDSPRQRRMSDVAEAPSEESPIVLPGGKSPAAPLDPASTGASAEASTPQASTSSLASTSHFPIIYPSATNATEPLPNGPAFRCEDPQTLDTELPAGGMSVSVHSPTAAIAWVEAHYDDPLLTSLRARNFTGPIAVQLSPDESALAIFGSIADAFVPQLARALARESGFAVVVRSAIDDPIPRFTKMGGDATPPRTAPPSVSAGQPASRLRGGAADAAEADEDAHTLPTWEGKYHNATVDVKLKMNDVMAYDVIVCAYMKFKTQPLDQSGSSTPRPRPEVLSSVSLEVKLRRGETKLDRSFSNIGFLVHRPRAIVKCNFLDFGYGAPDVKLKHTSQTSTSISGGGGFSLTGVVPTVSANASYTRGGGKGLESADETPMPKCPVRYDLGKRWERDDADKIGKDFESYDVSWLPGSDREHVAHEMQVEFGLGMNMRHDKRLYKEGLPSISFVLRNQIIVWVYDSDLRTKGRGILLLTSTYIPDALTRECLTIYETTTADLSNPWTEDPPVADRDPGPQDAAMSVSVAALDKSKKRRPPSILGKFLDKISFKSSGSEGDDTTPALPMYETVSRGWDATNMRWRNVIWPTLDHEFHGVSNNSKRAAWKLRWQTDPPSNTATAVAGELVPGPPAGMIPAVVVSGSSPMPIPQGNASKSDASIGISISVASSINTVSDNGQSALFDDETTVSTSVGSSFVAERMTLGTKS
ncbi:hypothetical protein DFH09DRAFT_1155508 [Mycena vulgaris]|nr:hypothetical protein DFH09DRAFT_1155508 [Mycena vulgaris]